MAQPPETPPTRVACDAMCGGLARWLRILGIDASFTAGITDDDCVAGALADGRVLVSSDTRLFERRVLRGGALRGLLLPVGLRLPDQVEFVFGRLRLRPGAPRCSACNGQLDAATRSDVADVVPARTLIWIAEYFRCRRCGRVFWEGTHWRRIREMKARVGAGGTE
ncbi:hypothetical protein RAS1_10710 [Phycisphaerae bacterium RAS1]|nr:hypothetical protein RAS1_10710 [Phycisphaerae bacterium RAS1]